MQKIATSRCCDWSNSARELRESLRGSTFGGYNLLQCSRREEMYATEASGFIIDWCTPFALENAAGGGSL